MVTIKDKNGKEYTLDSVANTEEEHLSILYEKNNESKALDHKLHMFSSGYGNQGPEKMVKESTAYDFQVDDASLDTHKEVIFTGGTVEYESNKMKNIVFNNETDEPDYILTNPIRVGKWEYWNLDIAAALQTSLARGDILPADCGKDDALFVGFGRNSTPINLTKTGLERNAGVFTHSTCVEKDEYLITETKRILKQYDIEDKISTCVNLGLEPPTTVNADWDAVSAKKYDIIIAATPPYDKKTGCYQVKSQIRGTEIGIEAAKDLTGAPAAPFGLKSEQYKAVAKFEDRCYDDNWGELNTVFRNAKSLLKPGGYILTIHNTYASDIDTFKPKLDECGLTLIEDGLLTRQAHTWTMARHWYMRQTLVGPLYPSNKYYMLCKV
jgi:hypothetical protein|tara:strand:+ start:463 stop:1608 length:1146 start_codon:yes stop_codon:yes gene_type:complete